MNVAEIISGVCGASVVTTADYELRINRIVASNIMQYASLNIVMTSKIDM